MSEAPVIDMPKPVMPPPAQDHIYADALLTLPSNSSGENQEPMTISRKSIFAKVGKALATPFSRKKHPRHYEGQNTDVSTAKPLRISRERIPGAVKWSAHLAGGWRQRLYYPTNDLDRGEIIQILDRSSIQETSPDPQRIIAHFGRDGAFSFISGPFGSEGEQVSYSRFSLSPERLGKIDGIINNRCPHRISLSEFTEQALLSLLSKLLEPRPL